MSLVRPDERGRDSGVIGFRAWVRAFVRSGLPVVFLPGGLHLPTIPAHRKVNAIDIGTPDKVAVAALALWFDAAACGGFEHSTFAVVEIGSAFSAILVVDEGRLVDAAAGTRGPIGLRSGGAWDGEVAYWRSPLSKDDLFRGGLVDLGADRARRLSRVAHQARRRPCRPSPPSSGSTSRGRGLEQPEIDAPGDRGPRPVRHAQPPAHPPGAWVKHAAQGAALLADGLAGGRFAPSPNRSSSHRLRDRSGTWSRVPRH